MPAPEGSPRILCPPLSATPYFAVTVTEPVRFPITLKPLPRFCCCMSTPTKLRVIPFSRGAWKLSLKVPRRGFTLNCTLGSVTLVDEGIKVSAVSFGPLSEPAFPRLLPPPHERQSADG